ncbi:kinase-like protein [Artomyces pyxidatus]|uniref:Kinase-like protein n=1 Tax=Artomyces pyxidatus TaxID=48021 RepID=A0ACB8SX30_9AGAM|nr:kinase-like protein [Artomyces pyxidatus]
MSSSIALGPLVLGGELGEDSSYIVFKALETTTGRVVAVKKTRISITIQRPPLEHEVKVLMLVSGHPAVPSVLAYRRIEYFEFIAFELKGQNLRNLVNERGTPPIQFVINVADQMLSALEHVHSRRIVHRDVKPSNILARIDDYSSFALIDFGISRPYPTGKLDEHDLYAERSHIVESFPFASLNVHNGFDITPRDDLESLAYTLFYILRGKLPWEEHACHGSILGRMAQSVFGELLDYARTLAFDEPIDYSAFRVRLQELGRSNGWEGEEWSGSKDTLVSSVSVMLKDTQCPVEV